MHMIAKTISKVIYFSFALGLSAPLAANLPLEVEQTIASQFTPLFQAVTQESADTAQHTLSRTWRLYQNSKVIRVN